MTRLRVILLFFLLLFLGATWDLKTDQEKVLFLMQIQEQYPDFFLQNVHENFQRDYFEMFDRVNEIRLSLAKDPQTTALIKNRPPLLQISIGAPSSSPSNQAKANIIPVDSINELEALSKKLKEIGTVDNFSIGLIKTLPKEDQAKIFKLPFDEKLEYLSKNLSNDLISKGFNPKVFGLSVSSFTNDQAIVEMQNRIQMEQRIITLIQGLCDKYPPLDIERELSSNKHIKPFLKAALGETKKQSEKFPASSLLILNEVPPEVATLRGCGGGDCSTKVSFSFSMNPQERIFFITDEKGGIKGYLAGTMVEINQKPAFYLHTIAGPRLSEKDVSKIIIGLHQAKAQMKFEEIFIPNHEQLHKLVNFSALKVQLESLVVSEKPTTATTINFHDEKIRQLLQNYTSEKYDDIANNQFPRKIKIPEDNLTVTINPAPVFKLDHQFNPAQDRYNILQFALGLHQGGNDDKAMRFGEVAFKKEFLVDLFLLTDNSGELPVIEYNRELQQLLAKEGLRLPAKDSSSIFNIGRLRAKDAYSPENIEETRKLLFSIRDWTPYWRKIIPGLKRSQDEIVILHIIKNLSSDDKGFYAIRSLTEISPNNPKIIKALSDRLGSSDFKTSFIAQTLDSLKQIDPRLTHTKNIFLSQLTSSDSAIILSSLRALANAPAEFSIAEKISSFIYHADENVRRQAARSLVDLKCDDLNFQRQIAAMASSHHDDYVKVFLVKYFTQISTNDEQIKSFLESELTSPIESVRTYAKEALAKMSESISKGQDCFSGLQKLVQ